MAPKKRSHKSRRSNRSVPPQSGLPKPSSAGQTKLRYNPTWNPQALKVMREVQYSAPAVDFAGGFGIIADPAVGCLATTLNYNSGVISFRIGDVYNVSEFGVLFDQYRIATVKLRFDYISASETVLNTGANPYQQQCTLCLYEDYDDSTAPTASNTGWQAVLETGRAKRKVFPCRQNSLTYTVIPKYLQVDVDNSGGTTGRSLGSGWLDGATSPDVIWRGVKWIIQSNPAPVSVLHPFRVTAYYYLQFRNRQ